ncbi:S41 family peptidase [Synechococcus sp. PCC 7336]|uniref:S41 family peptidase n=1 Tax=Synechococcus sp. PCC 7336 TaxID=195250 RepID=UPI001D0D7A56|nr:S41 family peptidase [Synechococcus sp. PCC 7336]
MAKSIRISSLGLLLAIASSTSMGGTSPSLAQADLPPIPIPATPADIPEPLPTIPPSGIESTTIPGNPDPIPPAGLESTAETAAASGDLKQVVNLFINESLRAGIQADAVNYSFLQEELMRQQAQSQQPPVQVEYDFIRNLLARYAEPSDRLLSPLEFDQLLNRPRPDLQAREIAPGVAYVAVPELTPATANQLKQALFFQTYSNGVVLDLRGSIGYDPQVVADVARLFLPRAISPILTSENRFGEQIEWDSSLQPIAAGIPLAVLVDGQTRQGAVLLAASLATSSSTVLAGEPTQGTSLQTQFYILPSGAAVELAIAKWQTAPLGDVSGIPTERGIVPAQFLDSDRDWLAVAPTLLPRSEPDRRRPSPSIFLEEGNIGRFSLGLDLGNPSASRLGFIDEVPRRSGENVFRPDSDLELYYLQDYVLFGYRNRNTFRSYFADRIYMTSPDAYTAEGIGIGDTYARVIEVYGPPGENGYNEINPYPLSSRVGRRDNLYFVNYDALGIGFAFEVGTNEVMEIGLYKAGS